MTRLKLFARLMLCLALVPLHGPVFAAATDQCVACHKDPHFYVQNRKLYAYYQDWQDSPHATSGLSCSICHGGDPSSNDIETAHAGTLDLGDPDNLLYYRNQPETCGACHADKAALFKTSKHYKALLTDTVAPSCTTCHRAMNRRPYYRDILSDACATCHNENNADQIPLIADQASQILQRLNVAKGYLGWTTVHYESQNWPGSSKCVVDDLTAKFEDAVTNVHSFNLKEMDESSTEILTELKLIFQEIWNERQRKKSKPIPRLRRDSQPR